MLTNDFFYAILNTSTEKEFSPRQALNVVCCSYIHVTGGCVYQFTENWSWMENTVNPLVKYQNLPSSVGGFYSIRKHWPVGQWIEERWNTVIVAVGRCSKSVYQILSAVETAVSPLFRVCKVWRGSKCRKSEDWRSEGSGNKWSVPTETARSTQMDVSTCKQ